MSYLKYRTLSSLMASVETDLHVYADNSMINRGTVIKVLRRCNADLGLKINREKETVLVVENHKAKLPYDFQFVQLALVTRAPGQVFHEPGQEVFGTVVEYHNDKSVLPVTCFNQGSPCTDDCGGPLFVTQRFQDRMVRFDHLEPVKMTRHSLPLMADNCINHRWNNTASYSIDIHDEEIICGFEDGHVYLDYLCDMVDQDNNVLILDHPLVQDYYEYACKKQILEMLMMNNDADVAQKLKYVKEELKEARIRANSFVNTIEFTEIEQSFRANRAIFYRRFEEPFRDNHNYNGWWW